MTLRNAAHVTKTFSYETAFLNGIHGIFVLDHLINDSHSEMNAVKITFVYTDPRLNIKLMKCYPVEANGIPADKSNKPKLYPSY